MEEGIVITIEDEKSQNAIQKIRERFDIENNKEFPLPHIKLLFPQTNIQQNNEISEKFHQFLQLTPIFNISLSKIKSFQLDEKNKKKLILYFEVETKPKNSLEILKNILNISFPSLMKKQSSLSEISENFKLRIASFDDIVFVFLLFYNLLLLLLLLLIN